MTELTQGIYFLYRASIYIAVVHNGSTAWKGTLRHCRFTFELLPILFAAAVIVLDTCLKHTRTHTHTNVAHVLVDVEYSETHITTLI